MGCLIKTVIPKFCYIRHSRVFQVRHVRVFHKERHAEEFLLSIYKIGIDSKQRHFGMTNYFFTVEIPDKGFRG